MNFLTSFLTNPLLAGLGALLGSVPIIIHILNRTFYQKLDWAAMEFLLRAEEKTRRRVQLENLILLLLRFLLLAILGLALAQPFLEGGRISSFLGQSKKHMVVVVDNSYSMQKSLSEPGNPKGTVFKQAREKAYELVKNNFHPENGDRISILTSSASPTEIVADPSQNRSRALKLIEELEASEFHGGLKKTLDRITRTLQKTADEKMDKKIFWFTDMQRNSWLPGKQKLKEKINQHLESISSSVDSTALVDVGSNQTSNIGIVELNTENKFAVLDRPVSIEARVKNFSTSDQTGNLILYQDEKKVETLDVNLKPNSEITKEFQDIQFSNAGPHSIHVEFQNDILKTDNHRYKAINVKEAIDVLVVNGEPGKESKTENESYFVQQALDPENGRSPFNVKTVTDYLFRDESLLDYDLVILTNMSVIRQGRKRDLRRFVKRGGGVLMFLGDQVTLDAYNENLLDPDKPFLPGKLEEIIERSYQEGNLALLRDIKFDHPALRYFQPYPQLLKKLYTQKWIRMTVDPEDPAVRVLARFDDSARSPAILERLIGRGKLMTVTTSADQDWNLWSNLQGYVILVNELTQYLLGQRMEARNIKVGSTVNLPISEFDYSKKFRLVGPDDRETVLKPRSLRDGGYVINLRNLEESGIYNISKEPENQNSEWIQEDAIAANLVPEEGNLTRTTKEELRNAYPKFNFEFLKSGSAEKGGTEMKQQTSNLWKYLAFLLIGFMAIESLLAMGIDRNREVE